MRREYFVSVLLALLLALISCERSSFLPTFEDGRATADLNGRPWVGEGFGRKHDTTAGFSFDKYDWIKDESEHISFQHVPLTVGQYELYRLFDTTNFNDDPIASFYTGTYDTTEDVYTAVQTDQYPSQITVDKWDSIKMEIKGSFEVYLAIRQPKKDLSNPDTLAFRNGAFVIRLRE